MKGDRRKSRLKKSQSRCRDWEVTEAVAADEEKAQWMVVFCPCMSQFGSEGSELELL